MDGKGEIVIYQPDEVTKLEVRFMGESIWLTQAQIAQLFGVRQPAISKHLKNIFQDKELELASVYSILEYTASDGKAYKTGFYNLDAVLSVGYRVNSKRATAFRRWSNSVLKEYLIRGYAINQRIHSLEDRMTREIAAVREDVDRKHMEHKTMLQEHSRRVDFLIKTSLPPAEGIFYDGQVFDAYTFVSDLIRSALARIVLIDNYIDDTVLKMLDKRSEGVGAEIYTMKITPTLRIDIDKHNAQYSPIEVYAFGKSHDRFLIIDTTVYHIGASLKDLGRKWFAFSKMEISSEEILSALKNDV